MQTYNLRSIDAAAIAFLVLVGLAVLLAGNRRNDQRRCYGHCINNLRLIGSGYDIFTVDCKLGLGWQPQHFVVLHGLRG